MNAGRGLTGYGQLVSQDTGGVLDHLSAASFAHLARQAYADATAWNEIGPVNGCTLADFCRAEQIDPPTWATTATERGQA